MLPNKQELKQFFDRATPEEIAQLAQLLKRAGEIAKALVASMPEEGAGDPQFKISISGETRSAKICFSHEDEPRRILSLYLGKALEEILRAEHKKIYAFVNAVFDESEK